MFKLTALFLMCALIIITMLAIGYAKKNQLLTVDKNGNPVDNIFCFGILTVEVLFFLFGATCLCLN